MNKDLRFSMKNAILTLGFLLGSIMAWAQPTEVIKISENAYNCQGIVRFKFLAGTTPGDYNIDNSKLMIQFDGEEAKELMYFDTGDCDDQIFSLRLEDVTTNFGSTIVLDGCERERPHGVKLKNARVIQEGGNRLIDMELHGVGPIRSEKGFNLWLEYYWYEDDDADDLVDFGSTGAARYEKYQYINSVTTTALRDECNPNLVAVTAQAQVACTTSGSSYRLSLLKSFSEDFSSSTTLIDRKVFPAAGVSSGFSESYEDTESSNAFYKTVVEYERDGVTFQIVESNVMPVQQFTVAPPVLKTISDDLCDNQINVEWEYNAGEADKFNIYRSSEKVTYLDFDGVDDRIEVLNSSGISPMGNRQMTVETWVRLDRYGLSQTLFHNEEIFLYMENGYLIASDFSGSYFYISSPQTLPLNVWVHVAFTLSWSGTYQARLFVNGEIVTDTYNVDSGFAPSFGSNIQIGVPHPFPNPAGYAPFDGGLRDLRIWDIAHQSIDPDRVINGSENNLVLYFPMNDGLPLADNSHLTHIQGQSPNSFQGQLHGFTLMEATSNFNITYENYQKIAEVDGKTFEYLDKQNIQSNELESYEIRAVKACGGNVQESFPSNALQGKSPTNPVAPDSLRIEVDVEHNVIKLDWVDQSFDETGFEIHRHFGDGSSKFSVEPNDTSYFDDKVVGCRNYEYDVYAKNICGLSLSPAQGSARLDPDLSRGLKQEDFKVSKGNYTNRVQLTWQPLNNTNFDRFRIFRKVLGTADSVQIDVVSGSKYLYRDETADAGVLYEYSLVAEVDCDGDVLEGPVLSAVGYRTATGLVAGQVTYSGGNSVADVKVLVSPADGTQTGRSLVLDGVDDIVSFDSLDLSASFTVEFWAKRADNTAGTIFSHGATSVQDNQNLDIGFTADGRFQLGLGNNQLYTTDTHTDTEWHHWAITYDASVGNRYIYKDGELLAEDQSAAPYAGGIAPFQFGASLSTGNAFAGQLDELRIWNITRNSELVARDHNRILNGNEEGIVATFSFDEGVGYGVYDRSRTGSQYNNRHGKISGTGNLQSAWSMNIPTPDQLGLYGITDENGNYLISAIPYTGTGQIFRVVPSLGVHQFEPGQTNLFIGSRSDIFNGTDFVDISAFPVTGTVFYKGTSCPADQIEIRIDGVSALLNGEVVTTNSSGAFSVDVPIGKHRISIYKEGHEFEVGRFPTDGSLYDFQEPISGIEFIDSTRLKVIGRVVGGTREGNKVPGLGRSVNNIGRARVIYESLVGNGCHRDTVFTDPMTGEYRTNLYPLKYVVKEVRVLHPEQNIVTSDFFEVLPQIDLINTGTLKTARDSVFTAGTTTLERVDSVKYHHRQDFIYRNVAEIDVLNDDKITNFHGEAQYVAKNGVGKGTTYDLNTNEMPYPVFLRAQEYRTYINVFERYVNKDAGAPLAEDKVPVTDGQLIINNQIAGSEDTLNVNKGDTLYTFNAGLPNLTINDNRPEFSYTKTMDITLKRPGQVADVKWEPNIGEALEDRVFRAYVLGYSDIIGSNFVTQGPDVPRVVVRDPFGDGSTASFTEETEISWSETVSPGYAFSNQFSANIGTGVDTQIGVGTSTNVKATTETNSNVQVEVAVTNENSWEQTWTTSEAYTTNGAEEAVGTRSDLYIGEQYNLVFGVTNNLELISNEVCAEVDIDCRQIHPSLPFQIGNRVGFRVSPTEQKTTFIYDQNYILNYLLPNLKRLRNALFINQSAKYQSKLPVDDENYGINNDDPVWGMAVLDPDKQAILDSLKTRYETSFPPRDMPEEVKAITYINNPYKTDAVDKDGMSYTWTEQPSDEGIYGIATDSVRYYNQQIRLWEKAIYENEKDKLQAFDDPSEYLDRNLSLNGGASFASESSYSTSRSHSISVEFALAKNITNTLSAKVSGNEVSTELETSHTFNMNIEVGRSKTVTTTWGYEIADDDQGDFINMEVYKSPRGWGPIFRNIAGQTSCPHEGQEVTQFYQKGEELSKRTLQRDKIEIDIFPKVVQNVPEGEPAVFNIQLNNTSETNDARIYAIRVDPNSNPDGLSVNMDGETITVENEFALAGSSVLTKAIVVERGPEKYQYNNIRLLVYAPCQYEAGTADEVDIVDTVTFSVSFLPECTDVRLKEPLDQWVVNNFNQDTLAVTIDNYDINKNGFEYLSLQYKPQSQSTWRELNRWWHPDNKPDEEGDKIPTTTSFIRYFWDMSSNTDGPYQLRAVSGCELVNNETDFKSGYVDRINPQLFGTPSPADGVCDPGEDLKIRFNENIDIGSLTSLNFDIRGVLNGTDIRHSESLGFDGNNDFVDIPGYDLTKRDFSFGFWAKPATLSEGTVIAQGNTAEGLLIGFDASGRFQMQLAGQTITTDAAVSVDEWAYFTAAFNYETGTASLLINGVESKVSSAFTTAYESSGAIRIGSSIGGNTSAFNGQLHELRLWSYTRSGIDIIPQMNVTLSPASIGLIGYWPMNEGIGELVQERVRSRNGVITGATWTILPQGFAFGFDGINDYLEMPAGGEIAWTRETDLTLEAWFKGMTAGTIFSNGKGDGTDSENSWSFGLDNSGRVVVTNNNHTLESAQGGLLDDNWHHFALVVDRSFGSVRLYVDSELVKTGQSENWRGFAGSKFWIGCRGGFAGAAEQRDQFFQGSLDEIRLWNTARQEEQIKRDWVNRLSGNELGLIAYYPFENYMLDAGVPVLTQSLEDGAMNDYHLVPGGSTSLDYRQPTPPIKLQRPVQKVNFSYVVNQDEIILTPLDPNARLEHVTLDITVSGVKDHYGNVLQSPITWIAFMNKNQVLWDRTELELVAENDQKTSFEVDVVNTGGSPEFFQILNLPSWLTAVPASGVVGASSSETIRFTIAEGVRIGSYEQDLFLRTSFGYNERFTLKLKSIAETPGWAVDAGQFQYSMSYVGELEVKGLISTDIEDQLAVFVDEELRGVANVELDPATNQYLVFLDVYSNEVDGEALEFRIWDASEGKIHLPISPTDHFFALHEVRGTPSNPQLFATQGSYAQNYELNAGWNWISFPLNSPLLTDVNEVLHGLAPEENDRILSQLYFDVFTEVFGWFGTLSSEGGFNRREGYKIYISNPGVFSYSGRFDPPSGEVISLTSGWNWIGFIAQTNIDLNTALASLNPTDGDIIKGQRSFAVYQDGLGWTGSLDYLQPTEGYMIRLAAGGDLTYPEVTPKARELSVAVEKRQLLEKTTAHLDVSPGDFEHTMSLVATVMDCNDFAVENPAYLAAFVGEECRGVYEFLTFEETQVSFLTVYGDHHEEIVFYLMNDKLEKQAVLREKLPFKADQLQGSPSQPLVLHLAAPCELALIPEVTPEKRPEQVSVYPNPFQRHLSFDLSELPAGEWVRVTIQDVNGRVVAEVFDGTLSADQIQFTWTDRNELSSGIYFVHIRTEQTQYIKKVTK